MSNLLIVGGGGREHALAWKLKQSPKIGKIFIAPGNAGTAQIGENIPLAATDILALASFAKNNKIDLTVVGQDDPLALGIVDEFQKQGLKIWGPIKAAARIESSKIFAKRLMRKQGIPTAEFETFEDYNIALKYIESYFADRSVPAESPFGIYRPMNGRATTPRPIVIKASGLALGKGVTVCKTLDEAKGALKAAMVDKIFGDAGSQVVIEEFLQGQEFSVHAFCDGKTFKLLPTAQDHKPVFDENKGPNTGGMGTIAPVPWVNESLMEEVSKKIVQPILDGLKDIGSPFVGLLYPGLILTPLNPPLARGEIKKDSPPLQGGARGGLPKVIEFNARFGDPETQSLMRLLKTDLYAIIEASMAGKLDKVDIEWHTGFACCIALASGGYPGKYEKGKEITGIKEAEKIEDVIVFHAGTTTSPHPSPHEGRVADLSSVALAKGEGRERLVTNGGRVLGVTAIADDLKTALNKAYSAVKLIHFDGMHYRTDIGLKSLPKT
jgi:phosphoribosylamine--glycine ligase